MGEVLLGALALVVILVLLWLFVTANPKALVKMLRYTGAGLLGAAAIGLLAMDRVGVGMLLASMAYGLFTGGRVWPGGWPHYHFPWGGGARAGAGQSTTVATEWLSLVLDHDTGAMSGEVLKGAYAGTQLSSLSRTQLLTLYREASADAETVRLLEAYFDRTLGPDWRQAEDEPPRGRARSGMSHDEAYRVLGLQPGASEDEIRAAHRKLMMQNHPDRGGSDYLASKINEAKDVLLGG